jgi:hypothetical protein
MDATDRAGKGAGSCIPPTSNSLVLKALAAGHLPSRMTPGDPRSSRYSYATCGCRQHRGRRPSSASGRSRMSEIADCGQVRSVGGILRRRPAHDMFRQQACMTARRPLAGMGNNSWKRGASPASITWPRSTGGAMGGRYACGTLDRVSLRRILSRACAEKVALDLLSRVG